LGKEVVASSEKETESAGLKTGNKKVRRERTEEKKEATNNRNVRW
jgi:hypothetical protein